MSDGIVIAGGGLAGQRCAETLRAQGFDGPIRMVCAEPEPPYDRPPLSKELLAGAMAPGATAFRPPAWYDEHDVDLLLGTRAELVDPQGRRLFAEGAPPLRYDSLLIATGSRPRTLPLPGLAEAPTLRTLADASELAEWIGPDRRLAVVGAGFMGLEVAATARGLGAEVTVVEAAPTPLAAVLGEELGGWFAELHRAAGVRLVTGARLRAARPDRLELEDGESIGCDHVLVAVGCRPDTDWLLDAGLALDGGGVPVDAACRTAAPGVFAAGDAALAADPLDGRPARSEHWEAAAAQGVTAARAMLGMPAPPPRLPSFWSDQYGLRVQCVGHPAHADSCQLDGDPRAHDFTALFTRAGHPVAALLVGRPRALAAARRQVQAGFESLTSERSTA